VIGTVTRERDLNLVNPAVAHTVALDQPEPADAIRANAPEGVDRIIEVAFSENADLDAAVAANDAVIAAYATRHDRPEIPFWPRQAGPRAETPRCSLRHQSGVRPPV
jgi:NADPH:quinone reductase